MCGILGWISFKDAPYPPRFSRGLDAMRHRGPDAEGLLQAPGALMGHRRLKIIDLSDDANQPMVYDDNRCSLSFNGEIYNFRELRDYLLGKGCTFRTQSDTEVLLRLYMELGEKCLHKLNGMFAFTVYDRETRELFAARDRMGVKPLYYVFNDRFFAAASEITSLLDAGLAKREMDPEALEDYLAFGAVQAPHTMIKDVKALLPGEYLHMKNGHLQIKTYWTPPFVPEGEKKQETLENAASKVKEILEDAVKIRLVSDVPLGGFLSGGIDSSAVVALMAMQEGAQVRTFSIGYDEGGDAFNETQFARQVVRQYNTDHNEFILTGDDVVKGLGGFIQRLDQPSSDGLNSYFVSKFAGEQITVCLSGTGGDELFAGYPSAKIQHLCSIVDRCAPKPPATIGKRMQRIFDGLPDSMRKNLFFRGMFSCLGAWPTKKDRYLFARTIFNQTDCRKLMNRRIPAEADLLSAAWDRVEELSPIDAACYLEQTVYLRNTLLRDIDVMSMAHSLEVRVPFLDHRLVEYTAGLPASLKYDPKICKKLLVKSLDTILPDNILKRRKMGFSFPMGLWLQRSDLKEVVRESFSSTGLKKRGIFKNAELSRILNTGLKADFTNPGSLKHYSKLWLLTVLELWMRETLDKKDAPLPIMGAEDRRYSYEPAANLDNWSEMSGP